MPAAARVAGIRKAPGHGLERPEATSTCRNSDTRASPVTLPLPNFTATRCRTSRANRSICPVQSAMAVKPISTVEFYKGSPLPPPHLCEISGLAVQIDLKACLGETGVTPSNSHIRQAGLIFWLVLLELPFIRSVNTRLVFRAVTKSGRPGLVHTACRRAGASLRWL